MSLKLGKESVMFEYRGRMLDISDAKLREYEDVTGLTLDETTCDAYLSEKYGADTMSAQSGMMSVSDEDITKAIIKWMGDEIDALS